MLVWTSIAAALIVLFLVWNLRHRFAASHIEALLNKHRPTSRMVGNGEFVEGNRHLKVALALTNSDLFYENADMRASLDLRWVREVEYDTSLATGQPVVGGRVLRMRCFSQVFEFVIPEGDVAKWHTALPARQQDESPGGSELAMRTANAT